MTRLENRTHFEEFSISQTVNTTHRCCELRTVRTEALVVLCKFMNLIMLSVAYQEEVLVLHEVWVTGAKREL